MYFDPNFIEFFSQGSNWQQVNMDSCWLVQIVNKQLLRPMMTQFTDDNAL